MKKLKVKVFFVIFSLLTLFTLIIFVGGTVRDYVERKNTVEDILIRIPRSYERNRIDDFGLARDDYANDSRRIYLDFTIYTIILDNSGNYWGVINNTNNDELEVKKIKEVANNIISNHRDNIYIGNLYTSRYAYVFTNYNTLVIMDNIDINNSLVKGLITNLLLFLLCEGVVFGFTYLITRWIISPVSKSFEKQKTFIADASHELKTPLSVMVASASAYFSDKDEKWVRNMKNESERMIKLVTELLDLAKTDGDYDIVMNEKNLSDIVESSILTFESLFYDNKIKLKYDITKDIKIMCNEELIVELMSILIDNAIKHCNEQGKVIVNLYCRNKQIILEVKNTGLPIKKEDEEKIFERFYKVDSSRNRNSNNYGLGLAIAKNIVERHNGNISVHSDRGYTTFRVIWNQK